MTRNLERKDRTEKQTNRQTDAHTRSTVEVSPELKNSASNCHYQHCSLRVQCNNLVYILPLCNTWMFLTSFSSYCSVQCVQCTVVMDICSHHGELLSRSNNLQLHNLCTGCREHFYVTSCNYSLLSRDSL